MNIPVGQQNKKPVYFSSSRSFFCCLQQCFSLDCTFPKYAKFFFMSIWVASVFMVANENTFTKLVIQRLCNS